MFLRRNCSTINFSDRRDIIEFTIGCSRYCSGLVGSFSRRGICLWYFNIGGSFLFWRLTSWNAACWVFRCWIIGESIFKWRWITNALLIIASTHFLFKSSCAYSFLSIVIIKKCSRTAKCIFFQRRGTSRFCIQTYPFLKYTIHRLLFKCTQIILKYTYSQNEITHSKTYQMVLHHHYQQVSWR